MKALLILLLALILVGCQPTNQPHSTEEIGRMSSDIFETTSEAGGVYQEISAEKVRERIDAGETVVIVDVRTQSEYDSGHIPGALLIPNESIGQTEPSELPDKDAVIVVYCRSGRRSMESANKLLKLGYQKVYDLGGIGNWPYDLETNNQ